MRAVTFFGVKCQRDAASYFRGQLHRLPRRLPDVLLMRQRTVGGEAAEAFPAAAENHGGCKVAVKQCEL